MPSQVRRSRLLALAVALAAVIATTGCDVMVSTFEGKGRATDTWTRTYDVTRPDVRVEIVNVNGHVNVTASEGSKVEVTAERTARASTDDAASQLMKQVEMKEEVSPDHIRIETRVPRSNFGRAGVEVKYTVKVPRTAVVRAETVNGGVEVVGVEGGLEAETTNGGVVGRQVGRNIKATTTNGGIQMEVTSVGDNGISLGTINGGIRLKLPEAAKGTLTAQCTNGGVSVSDTLNFQREGDSSRRHIEGRLNGGGPPIRLETTNGGITVSKS